MRQIKGRSLWGHHLLEQLRLCMKSFILSVLHKCMVETCNQRYFRCARAGFTRTVSAVFSVALLDVFLRTQLNILGRRVYLETARDSSEDVLPVSSTPWLSIGFGCVPYQPRKLTQLVGN